MRPRPIHASLDRAFRPQVDGREMERRALLSGGVAATVHNGSGTITAKDDVNIITPSAYGPLRTEIHLNLSQNYQPNGKVTQTASYRRLVDKYRGYAYINGKQYFGLFTEIAQGSIKNKTTRFPLRFALDPEGNVHVNFAKADIHETVTTQFTVNGKTYTTSKGTRDEWFGSVIQFGTYPSGVLPKQINGRSDKVIAGTKEHLVTTWKFHT